MKHRLLFALFVLLFCSDMNSQSVTRIYGASPFQDSLWVFDTTNFTVIRRWGPTPSSGGSITGMNSIVAHPVTGELFCIIKQSAVSGRVLGKFNPFTGVVQIIGNLGDQFASLTFNGNNTLIGLTGDGATVPETVYRIDQNTAAKTVLRTLGNGADGEVICYNPFDNMYYHWSGNGTVVFEKFDTSGVTVTGIPLIGSSNGEVFGAVYGGNNNFIISNIGSRFQRWHANGTVGAQYGNTTSDDIRGLAFVTRPRVISGTTYFCTGGSTTLTHGSSGAGSYQWYRNGAIIASATSQSYVATQPGWYNCLLNDAVGFDSLSPGVTVTEHPLPSVLVSGSGTICAGDSLTLVGTPPEVINQWYLNGAAIPGATSTVFAATTGGIYNMIATTIHGCSDSAAAGLTVVVNPLPVVSITGNTVFCAGDSSVLSTIGGSGYQWYMNGATIGGATNSTFTAFNSGLYNVIVTDANGCMDSAAVAMDILANPLPIVNAGPDTTVCGSIMLDAGNPGSSYLWCDGSTTQTIVMFSSGTCQVMVTDTNGCTGMDTVTVIVNPNPTPNLGPDVSNCTSVTLSDSTLVGGTYTWCNLATGPSVIITSTSTCELMYTDSNGCVGYDTINVTIYGNPTVTASASDLSVCADDADVVLTGSPSGGTFTGTSVAGTLFDPSVGAGTYSIIYMYTDSNGCSGSDSTINITVSACVGISENNAAAFTLFPNPSTGVLNITLPQEGSTVEVLDVLGNVVSSQKYTNAGTVNVNLAGQPEGLYFVRVTVGRTQSVQKVLISK